MAKRIMVKTGEFTDKDGNKKGKWEEVGVILENQDGQEYALLKPTVNLAGFDRQGKDSVIASIFTDNGNQGGGATKSQAQADKEVADMEDIPF